MDMSIFARFGFLKRAAFDNDEERGSFLSRRHGALSNDTHPTVWIKWLLVVSCSMNLLLFFTTQSRHSTLSSQVLYSPAQDAVRYKIQKFHRGFGEDKTIYQGAPSPEVDEAWKALYDSIGIIRIPRSEAERLPNQTYPFIGDSGYYIAELAVFHQLHCLNAIRIGLARAYYEKVFNLSDFDPLEGSYGRDHLSHCLDALREAVMCASDISVITWKWNSKAQKSLGHGDIVHSCRSFEDIRDWSARHKATLKFDNTVFVENDLMIPEF
ncbi:hypothetical protein JDV02_008781 [Purpureocillium takamizusanense]|uniref:Tat pathway signal sequence n=1 Tax=Purpureocillium takamizusanense TaxID=2060973 RepID=A0A9Q8VFM1_9HYPO|nr:uncharacterized protein JDV02_008781 [Purpureocillium takamizusanense]UNI22937.1 hypothetical protein JDV02_008781 [Purpureocillium takamizusanense]